MNVEIGMHHNQKITFEGEADQAVSLVGWFSLAIPFDLLNSC